LHILGLGSAANVLWPRRSSSQPFVFAPSIAHKPDGFIRLNSNENAYGPSPKVTETIISVAGSANRYPRLEYGLLRERIAAGHGVRAEQVLLGCGSTEILRMATFAFLGNGKRLLQALPTFEAIERYGSAAGSDTISVPLTSSFAHDLDSMLSRVDASTGLIYICNPNNPTASLTPRGGKSSCTRW